MRIARSFSWCLVLMMAGTLVVAQETPAPKATTASKSPLRVRQERVGRMVKELKEKLRQMAVKLAAKEPDQAKKLMAALSASQSSRIEERMREIAQRLDGANKQDLPKAQEEVINELQKIIEMLEKQEQQGGEAALD